MNRRMVLALLVALLVTLHGSGMALAASGPVVDWWVISGGGAPSSNGGNVALNDTLGQPVVGPSGGGSAALNVGYWVGCAAAPAIAPVVTVARDGADVKLAWDANLVNSQYQVWISTNPYFDPDHPGAVTPIITTDITYPDIGAATSLTNRTAEFYFSLRTRGIGASRREGPVNPRLRPRGLGELGAEGREFNTRPSVVSGTSKVSPCMHPHRALQRGRPGSTWRTGRSTRPSSPPMAGRRTSPTTKSSRGCWR